MRPIHRWVMTKQRFLPSTKAFNNHRSHRRGDEGKPPIHLRRLSDDGLHPPPPPPPPTPTRTLVQRSPARPRSKIYVKTPHQRGARAAPRIFWLAGPTRPFLFLKKRKGKRVEGVQVFRSSQKYCVSAFRSVIIPRSPPDRA